MPREGSKTATILDLLKRAGGATAKELLKATGWQPHFAARIHQRHTEQGDEPDRHVQRGRGADLFDQSLRHQSATAKTKRAERVPGFDQAPDFIIPSEYNPQVVI